MRVEVRADGKTVVIDGYVNAVERESRPVITPRGRCNEKVKEGTFKKALERAENVDILLDHDNSKKYGSTSEKNLQLFEDNIGLRAIATICDEEIADKAKSGKLKGWSFGMYVNKDAYEERADKLPLRTLEDIDIFEVSMIDEKMNPCYTATSIETRANGEEKVIEQRANDTHVVTENMVETPKETIDYSKYENRAKALSQPEG